MPMTGEDNGFAVVQVSESGALTKVLAWGRQGGTIWRDCRRDGLGLLMARW